MLGLKEIARIKPLCCMLLFETWPSTSTPATFSPKLCKQTSDNINENGEISLETKKIVLQEERNQGLIHYCIEKFVLWRLQDWKNNPRVNALIWKAVLSVISISAIGLVIAISFYLFFQIFNSEAFSALSLLEQISKVAFKSWVKLGMVLSGSITLAYWNMSSMFNKKWSYCADLYNQILKTTDYNDRAFLRNSLAIDLLTLDLWAHRSFSTLFKDELLLAAKHCFTPETLDRETKRILSGKYSESEAARLLETLNEKYSQNSREPK